MNDDGYRPIDKIFALLATATVLAGLVFVLWRAFGLSRSADEFEVVLSAHGIYAMVIGIVCSLALGLLLTLIFVRGRRREVAEAQSLDSNQPTRAPE